MFAFIKTSHFCLAAITLGCLGAVSFSPNFDVPQAEKNPQSPESHRGSGRVVTQVPTQFFPATTPEYRGTGRVHQNPEDLLAHRGSGRSPAATTQPSVAYRGSGRVMPTPLNWSEWV